MAKKDTINVGRDYMKHIGGQAQVTTGASIHGDQAQQFAQTITPQAAAADVAKLLAMVRQQLAALDLPDDAKEEIDAEIRTAEIQVKKPSPDKPKIVERLGNAATVLKEAMKTSVEAVAVGNAIGQAIQWCGAQWTQWTI